MKKDLASNSAVVINSLRDVVRRSLEPILRKDSWREAQVCDCSCDQLRSLSL